jgi:acyl-coenzyme A thioesterase PaaI-like protein
MEGTADVGAGVSVAGDPSALLPGEGSFIGAYDFGFEVAADGLSMAGSARVSDPFRFPGSGLVRPSVLTTIADCVAGIGALRATTPRLAMTLDITVRLVDGPTPDQLLIESQVVKRGRSTVAAEVSFSDAESGLLAAHAFLTFMASPRPQDSAPPILDGMTVRGSIPADYPTYVGLRVVRPGTTEVELTPFVEQAARTLQGGIIALLGETAAESLAGRQVLELDTRYLTAVRVGPGCGTATLIGPDQVRVEVRDEGNGGRLAALVMARMAP